MTSRVARGGCRVRALPSASGPGPSPYGRRWRHGVGRPGWEGCKRGCWRRPLDHSGYAPPQRRCRRRWLVLVHGVIAWSRYLMPLGEDLATDFPVLVPDLPGYGLNDPPPAPPTMADLADGVVAS